LGNGLYSIIFYGISLLFHSRENAIYLIFPSCGTWWIPSFFLGIISSVIPVRYIFKPLLGKRRYNELEVYVAGKNRITRKGRKRWTMLFYILSVIVIFVSVIVFSLLYGWRIEIFQDKIVVNQFRKLSEKTYDFNDVAELRQVRSVLDKNRIYKRDFHEIVFKDNYTLSFDRDWLNKDFEEQAEILKFISGKQKLKIKIIDPAAEKHL
jgi:hypothetical protein